MPSDKRPIETASASNADSAGANVQERAVRANHDDNSSVQPDEGTRPVEGNAGPGARDAASDADIVSRLRKLILSFRSQCRGGHDRDALDKLIAVANAGATEETLPFGVKRVVTIPAGTFDVLRNEVAKLVLEGGKTLRGEPSTFEQDAPRLEKIAADGALGRYKAYPAERNGVILVLRSAVEQAALETDRIKREQEAQDRKEKIDERKLPPPPGKKNA